jgi:hypothetical protein
MAFSLRLSKARWKVKIRDRERLEPPHVTILFKSTLEKRLDLRTGQFLEQDSSWQGIPAELRATIQESWERLRAEWDAMYPGNPVGGTQ